MTQLDALIRDFDEAFDAVERGDLERFYEITRAHAHPDCEFRSAIGTAVGGSAYRGPDGVTSWFADLVENTEERSWRNRRYETVGESTLLFFSELDFKGAASGARVVENPGTVFQFEDGLCVRIESFMSHDEAREYAEAVHA